MLKYLVGIDPGWKNLGFAITRVDKNGFIFKEFTCVMDPSSFSSPTKFIEELDRVIISSGINKIHSVTIERFVAYAGVSTAETENICMLIGSLVYYFAASGYWGVEPLLVRAIDWKTQLVKLLYKQKGFDNPSPKLDKKFSIAAAKACLDMENVFKTDHESRCSLFSMFT